MSSELGTFDVVAGMSWMSSAGAAALFEWEDPIGATLRVSALNTAYVIVEVVSEEGAPATVMISAEALAAAAEAARWRV